MMSASKSTLSLNNLKILRPKVTKNLMNLSKTFCEYPPSLFILYRLFLIVCFILHMLLLVNFWLTLRAWFFSEKTNSKRSEYFSYDSPANFPFHFKAENFLIWWILPFQWEANCQNIYARMHGKFGSQMIKQVLFYVAN
jgi:hypothetical protein